MASDLPDILVVDDEPRAVELLVRSLREQGRVETAGSADEAWHKFSTGDFALVISDQRMPGMSGVDLLGQIADRDDTVGRILLTGYADLEATVQAINRGRVDAYLHKPCAPPDLRATVMGVLARVALSRNNRQLLEELSERNRELDQALNSLASAQARMVFSERLAVIGKFSAMIVHDLRTPLTVVGSLGREILDVAEQSGNAELKEFGGEIESEVAGMQRMCSDLLEATRAGQSAGEQTRAALDEVVETALCSIVEPASAQGVVVEMQLESGVERPIDEAGLRRALRNLANNALEAMPGGGTLRVETRREQSDVVVHVSDTGIGIPDEIADRLFEPFVTAAKPGGTGLGLAIVRKVVDDHGGAVEVSKPEGGGTAFTLRLPFDSAG